MLGDADLMAFVSVTDLDRARAFYEGVLGLVVTEQNPVAVVVDAAGTMLRITQAPEVTPPGYTVLGWRVDDIARSVGDLAGRGVSFTRYDGMGQDDLGVWTTPGGDKVAWFTDPDGNVLSLTQFTGSA
jgi:catechol 2,3-dioxygenase-like lactoylglutathione lyase family enzyme